MFVLVAASLFLNSRANEIYSTTAALTIGQSPSFSTTGLAVGREVDPVREMATQLQVIRSSEVSGQVADALGPAADRIISVSARNVGDTDIVALTVQSVDPRVAAAAANAYAETYIEQRQNVAAGVLAQRQAEIEALMAEAEAKIAELEPQIDALTTQVATLEPQVLSNPAASPELRAEYASATTDRDAILRERETQSAKVSALQEQGDQLEVAVALQGDTGTVIIERASIPGSPISPTPRQDALVAAAIGLVLGLGLAYGRETLDDRIHDVAALEKAVPGVPVLASTPKLKGKTGDLVVPVIHAPSSQAAERFRTLRTGVEFALQQQQHATLLVTSAWGTEGKSTTVANLAVSLAKAGRRVAVVDCDLRRPKLAKFFGTPNDVGLSTYLTGDADPDEIIHKVLLSGHNLLVIPSGPTPQNPAELLGTPAMAKLFEMLSLDADVIIVDSPPVLPVADTLVLSRSSDAVLFVMSAHRTRASRLKEAINRVARTQTPVLGMVFAAEETRGHRFRYEGYYYGPELNGNGNEPNGQPPAHVKTDLPAVK